MSKFRWLAVLAFASVLALGVAACGSSSDETSSGGSSSDLSGEIAGAGSTAQQAAQEAWIAEFENANSGATLSYDPVGSGGGRDQFIAGGVAYAGSDAALSTEEGELEKATKRCAPGELIEVPNYVSPIAIVYNLPEVEGLQLSPETLAKIFSQEITTWNDKAIAADNPGVDLPDTRITPVNRSDESGTTENFTEYLSEVVPAATGRSRVARPPLGPPAWSKPSPPAKARSATPTPVRPANSRSPRSRSARNSPNRPPRPRRRCSRSPRSTRN
jgi:phosphate transport system substrate-binding protein